MSAACCAQPVQRVLWQDPGNVAAVDLGGPIAPGVPVPKPPFTFVREDLGGTQPKLEVTDAAGVVWNVKFGNEVKPESFAWRIPRALGYFVEPNFYVASGVIGKLGPITRRTPSLHADGHFTGARFQYRDPGVRFLKQTWMWTDAPFRNTPQLKGLAILVMLASNWDNKDGRVGLEGANTGLFEQRRNGRRTLLYSFTDWGSGMGAWGDVTGQTDWNCADYTRQSAAFVTGVSGGRVNFGYEGHIREGFQTGIAPADVAWLMQYLGRITDAQLHAALHASGAGAREETCFATAIRTRIEQLRRASNP